MVDEALYFKQLLAGEAVATDHPAAGQMANFMYLIGDPSRREAVIVDPAWDVGGLIDKAESDGYEHPELDKNDYCNPNSCPYPDGDGRWRTNRSAGSLRWRLRWRRGHQGERAGPQGAGGHEDQLHDRHYGEKGRVTLRL